MKAKVIRHLLVLVQDEELNVEAIHQVCDTLVWTGDDGHYDMVIKK